MKLTRTGRPKEREALRFQFMNEPCLDYSSNNVGSLESCVEKQKTEQGNTIERNFRWLSATG